MSTPLITAVICTRNRVNFLRKCVASLQNQRADTSCYEILVVDNGSADSTAEEMSHFQHDPRVRYVYEPVAGLSRARNTGWRNARGRYVGYIDDDAIADEYWISSAISVFTDISPEPSWVGGPIELDWEAPGPAWINQELQVPLGYVNWGGQARRLTQSERLGGGNSIYPKEVLLALGGFDERLGRAKNNLLSGEETQFQKKVEDHGGFLYYHPGIKIYHWVSKERMRPAWFYRRYYWGGITDYFMAKSLPDRPELPSDNSSTDNLKEGSERRQRLLRNLAQATGLFCSKEKTIQARVYLSYVVGYLAAIYRWKFTSSNH